MFKKLLVSAILFSLSLGPWVQIPLSAASQNLPANSGSLLDDLNRNIKRQEELKKSIANAQNQQKSLANQISYAENQIELTGLQVDETNNRLATLSNQIADTTKKLEDATGKYNHMVVVADVRIRKIYKEGFSGPLDVIFTSDNVNYVLIRQKYAEAVHKSDVSLMENLRAVKEGIAKDKADLEKAKADTDDLKARLVAQTNSLASQKNYKSYLLNATHNDEISYQRLLAQARLDQAAIQAALGNQGTRLGPVARGDIIAFQGNTGCSTGTHLHFGYLINGSAVDPMPYLNSGYLAWPETNPIITQPFGANPGLLTYGPQGHPAIDMTSGFGSPIFAAKYGIAYAAGDQGCPTLIPGTGAGKGIIIDHGDGTKTLYWHIK